MKLACCYGGAVDDEAREAERRWRASPDDASAERAAATLRRARRPLPWDLIAALPRWQASLGIATRFAATPPRPEDGYPEEVLAAAETRLGLRLPAALREWLALLGRWPGIARLDRLVVRPWHLSLESGLLVVLIDGPSRVSVREADLAREDPPLFVEEEGGHGHVAHPLARTFDAAVAREVAIVGPWGRGVRSGGPVETHHDGHRRVTAAGYPFLPSSWPLRPWEGWSLHGDDDTLLLLDGQQRLTVRARTPEAWARAEAVLRG